MAIHTHACLLRACVRGAYPQRWVVARGSGRWTQFVGAVEPRVWRIPAQPAHPAPQRRAQPAFGRVCVGRSSAAHLDVEHSGPHSAHHHQQRAHSGAGRGLWRVLELPRDGIVLPAARRVELGALLGCEQAVEHPAHVLRLRCGCSLRVATPSKHSHRSEHGVEGRHRCERFEQSAESVRLRSTALPTKRWPIDAPRGLGFCFCSLVLNIQASHAAGDSPQAVAGGVCAAGKQTRFKQARARDDRAHAAQQQVRGCLSTAPLQAYTSDLARLLFCAMRRLVTQKMTTVWSMRFSSMIKGSTVDGG